jgi:hypothetical protein
MSAPLVPRGARVVYVGTYGAPGVLVGIVRHLSVRRGLVVVEWLPGWRSVERFSDIRVAS